MRRSGIFDINLYQLRSVQSGRSVIQWRSSAEVRHDIKHYFAKAIIQPMHHWLFWLEAEQKHLQQSSQIHGKRNIQFRLSIGLQCFCNSNVTWRVTYFGTEVRLFWQKIQEVLPQVLPLLQYANEHRPHRLLTWRFIMCASMFVSSSHRAKSWRRAALCLKKKCRLVGTWQLIQVERQLVEPLRKCGPGADCRYRCPKRLCRVSYSAPPPASDVQKVRKIPPKIPQWFCRIRTGRTHRIESPPATWSSRRTGT